MQFIAYMLLSRYLHLYYYSRSKIKKIPTSLPSPGWEGRVSGNKQYLNFGPMDTGTIKINNN
jgi:hypothetical protein